jgi:Cu+-exporting ATPase
MMDTSTTVEVAEPMQESASGGATASGQASDCFHCGTPCRDRQFHRDEKIFCCHGCLTVFELLTENGLDAFYRLGANAGVRVNAASGADRFKFLDEPGVHGRIVDFSNEKLTRVTFQLPAIHCIACVWLLENLFQLRSGIGQSQVNFPRKEVSLAFNPADVKLSEVAALLASLGYEPELKLSALDSRPRDRTARRLSVQLGLAGFAFGNIMLFSISAYLGLDAFAGPGFRKMVGAISLLLTLPVVTYSAADYWRAAWTGLRRGALNIDVPIAAGIFAIFLQSTAEILGGRGNGYLDSLNGLIFFLLCGRWFQQKTYDRLAFDRDYKSFFPLSVTRRSRRLKEADDSARGEVRLLTPAADSEEEQVSLAQLQVGDCLIIRHGELIPADAKLISGPALIDYSFVTGESEPFAKHVDETLHAGGRQMGGAIEIEITKAVSQSYLTSLWNQEAFRKEKNGALNVLTNNYSRRFTKIIIAIAIGAALFWSFVNPAISLKAFTSVLIVACPCALALAAPFALGSAQRMLARRNVFLKNPFVLETLADVDTVVFDKTGTLTAPGAVTWHGAALTEFEERLVASLTLHSTHPLAVRIREAVKQDDFAVRSFRETTGCGMEGIVDGREIRMGALTWCSRPSNEADFPIQCNPPPHVGGDGGSAVHVVIDGEYRGWFELAGALRPETNQLIARLSGKYELALLSGDHDREREKFSGVFSHGAQLRFHQSPHDKLNFVRERQAAGKTVMMVGDGLNDAGGLKQSDVGVAVVENVNAFSPASDIIVAAGMVSRLADVLRYAKQSVRVVRAAFLISAVYNVIGVTIAASGRLSPVVCAILMPLSSATVVAFACGATTWLGRRIGVASQSNPRQTRDEHRRAVPGSRVPLATAEGQT